MDDWSTKASGTEETARGKKVLPMYHSEKKLWYMSSTCQFTLVAEQGTGSAAHIPRRKECAVYGQYLSVCPHSGGRNHKRQTKSIKRSDKRPIDIE